jgi:hypothetical protein
MLGVLKFGFITPPARPRADPLLNPYPEVLHKTGLDCTQRAHLKNLLERLGYAPGGRISTAGEVQRIPMQLRLTPPGYYCPIDCRDG